MIGRLSPPVASDAVIVQLWELRDRYSLALEIRTQQKNASKKEAGGGARVMSQRSWHELAIVFIALRASR